ncbi:hypothetical protein BVRB_3g067210 [Beta vulgaris subsp. vulgaris]|nr:hypothetical protein BVRB_3g067210 [Beta vulgaris subsp. vulgaris]
MGKERRRENGRTGVQGDDGMRQRGEGTGRRLVGGEGRQKGGDRRRVMMCGGAVRFAKEEREWSCRENDEEEVWRWLVVLAGGREVELWWLLGCCMVVVMVAENRRTEELKDLKTSVSNSFS